MFTCPVCFYDKMPDRPADYNICPCCGTEFENDDESRSHEELRDDWIRLGGDWFFGNPPMGWDARKQLYQASPQSFIRAEVISYSVKPMLIQAGKATEHEWNEVDELVLAS